MTKRTRTFLPLLAVLILLPLAASAATPRYDSPRDFAEGLPQKMLLGYFKQQGDREMREAAARVLKHLPSLEVSDFPKEAGPIRYISGKAPAYPYQYKASGRPGFAYALLLVDETGQTTRVLITEANREGFAANAAEAAVSWRFKPVSVAGTPVPFLLFVRMKFEMDEG